MARQFAAYVPWPVIGPDGYDIGEPGDARETSAQSLLNG
jgi:hypothetical protein